MLEWTKFLARLWGRQLDRIRARAEAQAVERAGRQQSANPNKENHGNGQR